MMKETQHNGRKTSNSEANYKENLITQSELEESMLYKYSNSNLNDSPKQVDIVLYIS